MSFQVYPQPDACRALMPTPEPHPPGPPSRPMACHMPKGHDGPHALTRRPGPIDRRWEGDARPDRPAPSPAAAGWTAEDALDVAHFERQREWSRSTFGPGPRTAGVVDHIRKELTEIEDDPADLGEWVDVIILAFDGAWRAGHEPAEIIAAVKAKQARNEARTWPDWRTAPPDKAIEHVRAAVNLDGPR